MRNRHLNKYLSDILIYSSLGCFTYLLLIYRSDIHPAHPDSTVSIKWISAILLVFNGVGLSVRYITERLMTRYKFFLKSRRYLMLSLTVVAVLLFCSNYFSIVLAKLIAGFRHPFVLVEKKWLYMMIAVWLVELIIVGQMIQNRFYADLIRLYKNSEELAKATERSRYIALQNQLDPHFLFNSLNTLISEISYNPSNAIEFTRNLADSYRYILNCRDLRTVPLSDELEFLDTYIELHKVRIGDCIRVDDRIDDRFRDVPVAPLTLQLLVENVLKHNVISCAKPMCISLSSEIIDGEAWLSVSNPVRPRHRTDSTRTGLINLSQRFKLLCGREIIVDQSSDTFTVKIPLEYD